MPGVRAAVVLPQAAGVLEPVVRTEVHDGTVGRQLGGERRRLAVRQRQEDQVGVGEQRRVGRAEHRSSPVSCGCTTVDTAPGLAVAQTAARSSSGCPAISRSSSPPAYPLAPATATRIPILTSA